MWAAGAAALDWTGGRVSGSVPQRPMGLSAAVAPRASLRASFCRALEIPHAPLPTRRPSTTDPFQFNDCALCDLPHARPPGVAVVPWTPRLSVRGSGPGRSRSAIPAGRLAMSNSATEQRLDPILIKWFALHARMQRDQCIQDSLLAAGRGTRAGLLAARALARRLILGAAGSPRNHDARRRAPRKGAVR